MSFSLITGNHILSGKSALIKSHQREQFSNAYDLLNAANNIRDASAEQASAARDQAYREGLAQGYEKAQNIMVAKLNDMAASLDHHEAERRASIAEAAMAAVRLIIGDMTDSDIVPGLAARALDRLGDDSRYVVEVAPQHLETVTASLVGRDSVIVEANPALGPLDCVVRTNTGRIIANLDTQIESLGQRWGVQNNGTTISTTEEQL